MEALKQEAIKVISKLPDTANIDDIMYEPCLSGCCTQLPFGVISTKTAAE